ncbi:hypothetical protein F511_37519 [Dorcoceras hygrometricum]|uniref:Uncharacterized protein n=1 Tax=Dorcoceras hygrometricum TaxID=472368 RepID=A0A2Z7CA36_9LAMI|nr:hypothetical protein F511_37519 [Dorcoceras hygrometricum]
MCTTSPMRKHVLGHRGCAVAYPWSSPPNSNPMPQTRYSCMIGRGKTNLFRVIHRSWPTCAQHHPCASLWHLAALVGTWALGALGHTRTRTRTRSIGHLRTASDWAPEHPRGSAERIRPQAMANLKLKHPPPYIAYLEKISQVPAVAVEKAEES